MSDANDNSRGGDSANNSVYYSAASSDNDSDQNQPEEEIVMEQVNFEGRRDHRRHEYRRRLTLDPLTDFIVNGDMLLEEAGSDADTSGDEQHHDDVNMQQNQANEQPIERDSEHDAVRQQLLVLLGHEMMVGDDGSSSDDADGYNQLNQNGDNTADDDVSHLLARDHAYLPTAQPLYPEEWIPAGRHRNRVHQSDSIENMSQSSIENTENNLILDPGAQNEAQSSTHYEITEPPDAQCLLPTQRSLHTDEEIDVQSTKVLAIMEVDDVVLFPGSVIPLRVRDPIWINYLGALIDDARGLYGSHSGSAGGMGEVQIGILPRISNRTRRRSRRSSSASSEPTGGGRMGRWRIDLIRRGVAAVRRPNRRRRTDNRDRMSTNSGDENEEESSHNASSIARERGSVRDERREESGEESGEEDEYFHPATSPPSPSNPYIGRVGTFATITFTHEEAAISLTEGVEETAESANEQERSRSRVWQRHRGEIVVTALGTKRFRIVAPVDVNATPEYQDRRYDGILFDVEEMNHSGAPMPPTWMLRSPSDFRYPIVTQSNSHVNAIWHLAQISSSPAPAYQSVWPWRIAQKICNLIQQTEQFQGIKKILPSAGGLVELNDAFPGGTTQFRVVDPSAFADWLSSNLTLSQNDRLDLLEMECRASQLKYLLKHIEKDRETILRCKCCSSPLSPMRNVFTVSGAEGTTGHYVNEHGVVHQTVTLREVDPKVSVVCVGRPETKDSWFPGYSWQIAYCYVCSSHLGWRFRQVSKSDDGEDPERPDKFWGFSCSSITTESAVAPRRVVFNRDSMAGMRAFAALGAD